MPGYILRRLAATLPVMLIVAVLVFLMLRLTPGDPAAVIAGDNANAEQVAAIRSRLGLDQPILAQFVIWFSHILHGDFGESFFFKKTVAELIVSRLEPSLALSVIYIALIARMTRTSVLDVMAEDYIRTARAKGQVERKVLFRHALKNAAVPIVTVIGLGIALLIGGVVVTESVFTIPGIGRLTVDAVLARDYPTIQAVILLFSFVYVMINLAVDMFYTILDPRIRY